MINGPSAPARAQGALARLMGQRLVPVASGWAGGNRGGACPVREDAGPWRTVGGSGQAAGPEAVRAEPAGRPAKLDERRAGPPRFCAGGPLPPGQGAEASSSIRWRQVEATRRGGRHPVPGAGHRNRCMIKASEERCPGETAVPALGSHGHTCLPLKLDLLAIVLDRSKEARSDATGRAQKAIEREREPAMGGIIRPGANSASAAPANSSPTFRRPSGQITASFHPQRAAGPLRPGSGPKARSP